MKKAVCICIMLAALSYLTAFASSPSQSANGKSLTNTRRAKAPAEAHHKGVNTTYDMQVKKGHVDAAKVEQPSTASADKSIEHASPLKVEYLAVLAQIAEIQARNGDFSALKARASELYAQIHSHDQGHALDDGGETCAQAPVITSLPYQDCGSTVGAVNDYSPGTCAGSSAPDKVYVFTPAQDVVVTVSLLGSSYDTMLGIYEGCPDAGSNVGCNDDFGVLQSCLTVTLLGGHTYYIDVDGFSSNAGQYRLNITTDGVCHDDVCATPAPENDLCSAATPLALGQSVTGTTIGATDDNAPDCGTTTDAVGVWYTVVGDGNTLTASTCGNSITNYDSKLHIYTCGCENLTCVTGNDDCSQSPNGLASIASWCSRAGETYWVLVEGFGGSVGNFELLVSSDGLACEGGARCPCWDTTLEAPGTLSGSIIDEDADCIEGCPDYAVQVTIPFAGMWNFSLCGSDYDTYLYVGSDCCMSDICANDDSECDGQFTLQSNCCVSLDAGVYYVTVLGYACGTGNFVLTVGPCGNPGETCANPIVIFGLPYFDSGSTADNTDDIEIVCEWGGGLAPDVVYSYTPASDVDVNVSLCHSWYDTKVGIIDAATGEQLCCNDDACDNPDYEFDDGYQSLIECCHLLAGHTYCIVVEGFGDASGEYELSVIQGECGGCEPPANDDCVNVLPVPLPLFASGDNSCATEDCPLLAGTGQGETWHAFTIDHPCDVRVRICGANPAWTVYYIVLTTGCPCGELVYYTTWVNDPDCPNGIVIDWAGLPAGTYYYPVLRWDELGSGGPYTISIECLGGECNPTPYVQFGTHPVPSYYCADLCPGAYTGLVICGEDVDPSRPPIVTITPGCSPLNTRCERDCAPAEFIYDPFGWSLDGTCWYNSVIGVTPGCVCVCLEGFLGVELNGFAATSHDGSVELTWSTASETNNERFDVLRNGETIAQVASQGNGASAHTYTYTDHSAANGMTYTYSLVSVDLNGAREEVATTQATPTFGSAVVTEYALHQNFPNPFNPETNITFDLVESGNVTLKVFNLMGQEVATLVNGLENSGRHTINFTANNLPSGVYVYKLNVNGMSFEKKMLLMK